MTSNIKIFEHLSVAALVEHALKNSEGHLAQNGALVVFTGGRTGRSPKNRFIVDDAKDLDWGEVNKPIARKDFEKLWQKALEYMKGQNNYTSCGYAGADPKYRLSLQVVAQKAWHALFAKTLFIRPSHDEAASFKPDFTILNAADLTFDKSDGSPTDVFIGLDLKERRVLIAGSGYGGEMKKAIFAAMNYFLPEANVFPMHCSANVGDKNDTALFFGLSGTGKTTLSADPFRHLIGDDEHGWAHDGIFNFEGGCYAKVIRLSAKKEPQIYDAIKFGSILENVIVDECGVPDYDSAKITENTRATYPLEHIAGVEASGKGAHPKNIFFLACDAFGVLPPIAELTPEMAMYHFLSGYTAKVAGTEAGITDPVATFSACFGAPFMPRHPAVYAHMLGGKMKEHKTKLWLVNTGWSGGSFGVGKRMDIDVTRALLKAAMTGDLAKVERKPDPVFKILVPQGCQGIDSKIMDSKSTWKDKRAYDENAKKLSHLFADNFAKFESEAGREVANAGPRPQA